MKTKTLTHPSLVIAMTTAAVLASGCGKRTSAPAAQTPTLQGEVAAGAGTVLEVHAVQEALGNDAPLGAVVKASGGATGESPSALASPEAAVLPGRTNVAQLVAWIHEADRLQHAPILAWANQGKTAPACGYLASSLGAHWVVQSAIRNKAMRVVELYGGARGNFDAPRRTVQEGCEAAVPAASRASAEFASTPALIAELRQIQQIPASELADLIGIGSATTAQTASAQATTVDYFDAMTRTYTEFCATNSRYVGNLTRLQENWSAQEREYQKLVALERVLGQIAIRPSEILVAGTEIVGALQERMPERWRPDTWIAGTVSGITAPFGLATMPGLIASLGGVGALASVGITAGIGALPWIGFAIYAAIQHHTTVIPRRIVTTDLVYKVKGAMDVMAVAAFSSVRVRTFENAQRDLPPVTYEVVLGNPSAGGLSGERQISGSVLSSALESDFRNSYTQFANALMNTPRVDSAERFSSEVGGRIAGLAGGEGEHYAIYRHVCDAYPLEWDTMHEGEQFCRRLHQDRCNEGLRAATRAEQRRLDQFYRQEHGR